MSAISKIEAPTLSDRSRRPVPFGHQGAVLSCALTLPPDAMGLVLFAHSEAGAPGKPRNQSLVHCLAFHSLGVLQVELCGEEDGHGHEELEAHSGLMAERLAAAMRWARQQHGLDNLPMGCLGFEIGGNTALRAAGALTAALDALIVVDALPDPNAGRLDHIHAATLLIVSDSKKLQRRLNDIVFSRLHCEKEMQTITNTAGPAAGGERDQVAVLAAGWFHRHLHRRRTLRDSPARACVCV